ncbi:MAG: hypothetical protein NT150_07540 [Bacteroidetes bacterium]|nr:hypothetical protein [Bacteroidota bacterium]
MSRSLFFCLFFICAFSVGRAQTQGNTHLFDLSYSGAWGNGEVAQKSTYINRIGVGYSYKLNKLTMGLQYYFLFGDYAGPDIFAALRTSEGLFIASDGSLTDVAVFFRGNGFYASIGRAIPLKVNDFLGLNFCAGALQNRLAIRSLGSTLPFLSSESIKGYDQYSLGPSVKQEIRWTHLGPKKRINFYLELFAEEALLKNLRKYNYFNGAADESWHFNFMFGIQAGWIIPVYANNDEEEFID